MKKPIFIGLILLLSLLFSLSVQALGTITLNTPLASTETNTNTLLVNATATQGTSGSAENVTNMTFIIDSTYYTNGTMNGSTPFGDLSFTLSIDISALSEGSHTIIAEARNQSDVTIIDGARNSSSRTFIVDNINPTCRIDILVTEIEPLNFFEINCKRSTDTNTINTSSYRFTITDPHGRAVVKSSTSGIASFDGSDTETEGLYTATCFVYDNAGNNGTCKNEEFQVRYEDGVVTPSEKVKKAFVTPKKSYVAISLTIVAILFVIVIVLVLMYTAKGKGKKKFF